MARQVAESERAPASAESDSISSLTRKNVEIIGELEKAANAHRSPTVRLADAISGFVGSMLFVYLHLIWFAVWRFVVSLEAIFLSTFILISQNHEERLARRRNHLDLQINLLSEQENGQILKMLTNIESRLEIQHDDSEEALQQCVKPEELVSQIENVIEHVKKD